MKTVRDNFFLGLLFLVCAGTANAQWQATFGPTGLSFIRVQCFAKQGTNLFAGTQGDGVWISTDNSASPWTKVSNGLPGKSVIALLVNGTDLFAGTDSGVFKTTNNGTNWISVNDGLTDKHISSLALIGDNLFAGTNGGGVFLSSNNGLSWTTVNSDLTNLYVTALAVSGTNLFAGTFTPAYFSHGGVFLSTNNGTNWTQVNTDLTDTSMISLATSVTNLFAASQETSTFPPSSRVFVSTNNGTNWGLATTGLPASQEITFAVSGINVFVGAYSNGVYLTTNNGSNWIEVNEGFGTSRTIRTLAVLGEDLFAGFYEGSVKRRPLSQMITSVESISDLRPTEFTLDQNYPNPFNPTTTIRYAIPHLGEDERGGFVTLKVYDVLGNEVSTLVDEYKPAGSYEVNFNASGLASGVYYYQLKVGSLAETKKLILMK